MRSQTNRSNKGGRDRAKPLFSFEDYPNETISKDDVINIMVGDTQRIQVYANRGFQIAQDIPVEVWSAYEELVRRGFTSHLIE
jgi:hypothetical protein